MNKPDKQGLSWLDTAQPNVGHNSYSGKFGDSYTVEYQGKKLSLREAIEDYTTKKIDHELSRLIKDSVWKSHVPNEQIKERITELRAKAKEMFK